MAGNNQKPELDDATCEFCSTAENNWLELGSKKDLQDVVTHYYCLLLSSEMEQKGADNQGILGFLLPDIKKELARGKKQKCCYCNKHGATIRCTLAKCKKNFHLPCGIKNNSLHQFFKHFKSFCGEHRPIQKIPANLLSTLSAGVPCGVCLDELPKFMSGETIWSPCCRKGAWFHRPCVQQQAITAGYFFKCPLCNDKEKFHNTMLDCGIFIPEQDAAWESEPHAFEDLLHRHGTCDHPACRDPLGRTNNVKNTRWEVILCELCGSQGVHMACGQLSWSEPVFECDICRGPGTRSGPVLRERAVKEDENSDESDQDSQESLPLSLATSPLPDIRVDSPDELFVDVEGHKSDIVIKRTVEGESTTPPLAPPLISGPFPLQPTRRQFKRGRPPLKRAQQDALTAGPSPVPITNNVPKAGNSRSVLIPVGNRTSPSRPIPPGKFDVYNPDAAPAPGPSVLSNFTVVGNQVFQPKSFSESVTIPPPPLPTVLILNQSPSKVFQPKSFSESVTIPPPPQPAVRILNQSPSKVFQPKSFSESVTTPPPPQPAVRILNQSPSKVSTTARSTLFPQSRGRVAPEQPPTTIIDLIDDSDDDEIKIIEDKRSSVKELVTRDGSKIPVVKVPVNAPIDPNTTTSQPTDANRRSPDLEIIEALSTQQKRFKTVFVRRKPRSQRSQESLSPLRLALELPLVAGQPAAPEAQVRPGSGQLLAPRRLRPILPATQQPIGIQTQRLNSPQDNIKTYPSKVSSLKGQSPNRKGVEQSPSSAKSNAATAQQCPPQGQEMSMPDASQVSWLVPPELTPKRIRLQSPSSLVAGGRPSTDPPSYEETMKNDQSQARYLPMAVDNVEAVGSQSAAGAFFVANPAASFGNLLDSPNLFRLSRTSSDPAVSSFMLTPVGPSFVQTATQQPQMSVGGYDPGSQLRGLQCDPGCNADANGAASQTASAASARSERQNIDAARQVSASKAVGRANLPGCDRNRLINLRTAIFKIKDPNLVQMTANLKDTLIPITLPDKKVLIPVKPTVYMEEKAVAVKVEPQKPLKLQKAKRGAAFARPNGPAKPRRRGKRSAWCKGLIAKTKKKIDAKLSSLKPDSSSLQAPTDSAPNGAIAAAISDLNAVHGPSTSDQYPLIKFIDTGHDLMTKNTFANLTPTTQRSLPAEKTSARRESPATENGGANTHSSVPLSADRTKNSVKKQLFATESPNKQIIRSESPENGDQPNVGASTTDGGVHVAGEETSKLSGPSSVKGGSRFTAGYLKFRRKQFEAVASSVQGQCLTRRTRSVMKSASYSTRSKVSLEKYNFKQDSTNYVPLLRKGYLPKCMKSAGMAPKISTADTYAMLLKETEVSQSSSSGKFAVIDSNSHKSESDIISEDNSFCDSFASASNKLNDCVDNNANSSDSLRPSPEESLAKSLAGNSLDDLISEDEDFYSMQNDSDIDDEDDAIFIERTVKEYQKIDKISTVKAKALTARKFRPASDTEKMQREMLLKLRELPSAISDPHCDL